MRRLILAAAALASLAVLANAAPASAYDLAGDRWPEGTIRYYANVGSQNDEVERAAAYWNKEKLGIKLKRTSSKSKARVVVGYGQRSCGGLATVGYYGPRFVGEVQLSRGCPDGLVRLTATHEFGHVLGLGHENRRCALMNPVGDFRTGTPNRCSFRPMSYWLSRPIQSDDRRGARDLYEDSLARSAGAPGPVLRLP